MVDFKVGDEVVCVKEDTYYRILTVGSTYTVKNVSGGLVRGLVSVCSSCGIPIWHLASDFKLKEQTEKEHAFRKFYIATNFDGDFDHYIKSGYNLETCASTTAEGARLVYCEYHGDEPKYIYEVSKRFIRETNFVEG